MEHLSTCTCSQVLEEIRIVSGPGPDVHVWFVRVHLRGASALTQCIQVQWAALAVLQSLFLETPWEKVNQASTDVQNAEGSFGLLCSCSRSRTFCGGGNDHSVGLVQTL